MDSSSAKAFAKSPPKIEEQTGLFLSMESLTAKAIERETAALAKNGFIGCLPIGKYHDTWVVSRLLPNVPFVKCPVGEASKTDREGSTFSPDLARLVAGRIAHVAPDAGSFAEVDDTDVLATAEIFGERAIAARVLAAARKQRKKSKQSCGELFAVADSEEPWFDVLAAAWSKTGRELSKWLKAALTAYDLDLIHRLHITATIDTKSKADITESAWRCITGDVVFDATYNGSMPGPWLMSFDASPYVHAVRALADKQTKSSDHVRAESLKAGMAYVVDLEGYDGSGHLNAANVLAKTDPVAAYIHAANAAMFQVRGEHGTPKKAIALALRIAKDQAWNDLVTVLTWGSRAR